MGHAAGGAAADPAGARVPGAAGGAAGGGGGGAEGGDGCRGWRGWRGRGGGWGGSCRVLYCVFDRVCCWVFGRASQSFPFQLNLSGFPARPLAVIPRRCKLRSDRVEGPGLRRWRSQGWTTCCRRCRGSRPRAAGAPGGAGRHCGGDRGAARGAGGVYRVSGVSGVSPIVWRGGRASPGEAGRRCGSDRGGGVVSPCDCVSSIVWTALRR